MVSIDHIAAITESHVQRYLDAYLAIVTSNRDGVAGSSETLVRSGLGNCDNDIAIEIERLALPGRRQIDCQVSGVCYDVDGRCIDRSSLPRTAYQKEPIPVDLRWEVWERDNFTCRHCGIRRYLVIDHLHPESKGGQMTLDNLQTLCRSCNSRKGDR